MELWVIWRERRDDTVAWRRGVIRSPDRPSTLKFVVELASVLLITGGIVGELWIGIEVTSVNGALRGKSAELRSKTGQLVVLLNVKAGELQKEADGERLARMKLQAQIQPRSYTAAEISVIDKACKPYVETAVFMRSMAYDVEGAVFGTYLAQILQSKGCGLKVNASGVGDNFMLNLPMFMDVHVTGPPDKLEFINALVGSLNTPRVRVIAEPPRGATGTPVYILVGAKRLAPKSN
jgi:hypothetical protein